MHPRRSSRRARFVPWALALVGAASATGDVVTEEAAPPAPTPHPGVAAAPRTRSGAAEWKIGDPSGDAQYLLELMNRARADPHAEGDRIFVDYGSKRVTQAVDSFLAQNLGPNGEYTRAENRDAFYGYPAKPPFAFNGDLMSAAAVHTQAMVDNKGQSHQFAGEAPFFDRIAATGYSAYSTAESIFAFAQDMLHAHAGFAIDYGQPTLAGETRPHLGHRLNLMGFDGDPARDYREVGIDVMSGSGGSPSIGPKVLTIDFARPADDAIRFVTGVCWIDRNSNGSYDPGEGVAGVRVDVDKSSYYAVSTASGGYAIPVAANAGTVVVTATGGSGTPGEVFGVQQATKVVAGANVKADFTVPPPPDATANSYAGGPLAFDDVTAADAAILVPAQPGVSADLGALAVDVDVDCPRRENATLTLVDPQGTEVLLFDRGAPGSGLHGTFGTSLRLRAPLDPFLGQPYAGTWHLRCASTVLGDGGTLRSVTLHVQPAWVRPLAAVTTPLSLSTVRATDSKTAGRDSLQVVGQVELGAAALPAPPDDVRVRLLAADGSDAELFATTFPKKLLVVGAKGTSRATFSARITSIDLPPGLADADVLVELAAGDAILAQRVHLTHGAFAGAARPLDDLFRVDAVSARTANGVTRTTVRGRVVAHGQLASTGSLEVRLGAFRGSADMASMPLKGTKYTLAKAAGILNALTVDSGSGVFTATLTTSGDIREDGVVTFELRLGDSGFFGRAAVRPAEKAPSLTY